MTGKTKGHRVSRTLPANVPFSNIPELNQADPAGTVTNNIIILVDNVHGCLVQRITELCNL